MFTTINYYTISLLVGGFAAFFSGSVIFLNNKTKPENQAWFAMTVSTSVWSFAYFYMTATQDKQVALHSSWVLHYAAIFIPLFYFLLVLIITNTVRRYIYAFSFFTLCAAFFVIINPTSYFVSDVVPKVGFNFAPVPGPLYIYYFIFFSTLVLAGILICIKSIFESNDPQQINRFKYTIYFTLYLKFLQGDCPDGH